ncbi:MAG TPA: calcium-binding protein, partial [Allosphingosinicella sp.]
MANIDLKNNDYDGQTIVAVQYGSLSRFVGPAGDFDGDGFDDLLLRSYYRHDGVKQEIEVWLGGPAPLERGFVFSGDPADDDNFADILSAIGDINGDGFDDIIGGDYRAGQITVYLGRLSGSEGSSFDIVGALPYRLDFAPAGDINADGLDDFIIGQPSARKAHVIFGTAEGHGQMDLSNLPAGQGFAIVGAETDRGTGHTVASAGDINDDGFDDIMVGVYRDYASTADAPQAYVVFGKAGGFGTIDLGGLDPADGFAIIGKPEHASGSHLAAAGDVNGDGIDDFMVGGPNRAFIIYGKSEGLGTVDLTALAPADGYRIAFNGDLRALTSAGDINGDGLDDIILAVNITPIGRASFVIYGQTGQSNTVELPNLDPERGFSLRGDNDYNAAGVGDLNGDGFGDTAVTGHRDVHVIYGGARFNPVAFTGTDADEVAEGGIRGDELQGGGGNDILIGREGHDLIRGGDGDDVLSGGGDDDLIDGGAGSDTADYSLSLGRIHVDLTSGLQNGGGAAGFDTLVSIENVIGSSAGSIIIGNGESNRLTGGNAVDRIQGGGGGDLLDGGGSDYDMVDYSWAGIGVRVALDEAGPQDTNAGIDTLTGFENLTGSDFNDILGGDDGHNRLDGGKGDDRLRGNAGYDTLVGGEGSDTAIYFGSAAGVTVSLNQNEQQTGGAGNDYLYEIENLVGTSHADRLIGNAAVNFLDGGEGDDALDSGGGGGRMIGRGGDDRYTVRHVDDLVVEAAGAGTELVISRIESYALGANVENLILEGLAGSGIGNGLDNYIRGSNPDDLGSTGDNHLEGGGGDDLINGRGGNDTIDGGSGDDTLTGLGGTDTMSGGSGNDLFHVSDDADAVVEAEGGGIDTVSSRIDYRLGANVENLILRSGISGIGNELANSIIGNNG